jgi:predicted outer membrane protein
MRISLHVAQTMVCIHQLTVDTVTIMDAVYASWMQSMHQNTNNANQHVLHVQQAKTLKRQVQEVLE